MGHKTRNPELNRVFNNYRDWYAASDMPGSDDQSINDPLGSLAPLSQRDYAGLEAARGTLPRSYRELVCTFGVGRILIAAKGEPVDFTILPPKHIDRCHRDFLSWIDKDLLQAAKARQGLDGDKLMPFLVDRDWNQWALLANQHKRDDRVFLFSHEQEQLEEYDLFKNQGSLADYFRALFDQAKQGYSAWYLWTGRK